MAEYVQRTREIRRSDMEPEATETRTITTNNSSATAARVVWYVAGILLGILGIRFLLALLGANPANAFASFMYSISYPFVAPFFGLFSYNLRYGVSHFESYTLVAIAIYALIAYAIARLLTLSRPDAP
jgi:hypothetical protein